MHYYLDREHFCSLQSSKEQEQPTRTEISVPDLAHVLLHILLQHRHYFRREDSANS